MTQGEASSAHAQREDQSDVAARKPRDLPMIHSPTDPPLCVRCRQLELSFFDPNCPDCQVLLSHPGTSIAQLFAILRQWTPETQANLAGLVQQILSRGGHVNDRDGLTDMTLLHYAAKSAANGMGDLQEACHVINMLIAQGADVFVRCRWTHMSALHYAVYFDAAPVISLLLHASKAIAFKNNSELNADVRVDATRTQTFQKIEFEPDSDNRPSQVAGESPGGRE